MTQNIDRFVRRLNERLMSCAQYALNDMGNVLEELEIISENNPDREDIRACIDDIKSKNKKALTEGWIVANHWSEHFESLSGGEDTEANEPKEFAKEASGDEEK